MPPTELPQGPGDRADDLAPGSQVGPWQIERELGRGGMGTVYAVVHAAIGKRAALKVIHRQALIGADSAACFLTEARAVNAVGHANIVDIFESGTLADGRPFLVMERLLGKTLGDRQDEGRVPTLEAIDYLVPLCDALIAAHAIGVVHRDIKLDNVFVVDASAGVGPTVKLLDWGIASMVEADDARAVSEVMVGTPRYVSPEQARGQPTTPASDVYSLGVVAYELFLEAPPFCAPSAVEVLAMHLTDAPPPPHEVWPQIPHRLETLLLAMLAKAPALRPTVVEVAETLRELRGEFARVVAGPSATVDAMRPSVVARPAARTLTSTRLGRAPTVTVGVRATGRSWFVGATVAAVVLIAGLRQWSRPAPTPLAWTVGIPVVPAPRPAPVEPAAPARSFAPVAPSPRAALVVETSTPIAPARRPASRPAILAVAEHPGPAASAPRVVPVAPAATAAPRPAPRVRLHPDAVIDPY